MTAIEDLLARNATRTGTGPGPPPSPPGLQVAVVACMDARLDPAELLGLQPGDAHVIRNAGGESLERIRRSPFVTGTTAEAVSS